MPFWQDYVCLRGREVTKGNGLDATRFKSTASGGHSSYFEAVRYHLFIPAALRLAIVINTFYRSNIPLCSLPQRQDTFSGTL